MVNLLFFLESIRLKDFLSRNFKIESYKISFNILFKNTSNTWKIQVQVGVNSTDCQ